MRQAIVINGKYKGRKGQATEINPYGNVMFYPKDGHPYEVVLDGKDIEFVIKKKKGEPT